MFSSTTLRAIRPSAGGFAVREQRLDDVVHLVEVRGPVDAEDAPRLATRFDAALADGVRWIVVDLSGSRAIADQLLPALMFVTRVLRSRRGELILAGAEPTVAERLTSYDVPDRPALAASVDQALMILKLLRPKTRIEPRAPRSRSRTTSLTLPRVEPSR